MRAGFKRSKSLTRFRPFDDLAEQLNRECRKRFAESRRENLFSYNLPFVLPSYEVVSLAAPYRPASLPSKACVMIVFLRV